MKYLLVAALLWLPSCGIGLRVGEKPVLYNLLVDIETCPVPCTGGAFVYSAVNDAPIFFGGTVTSPSGPKIIPNIEFRVRDDADILSPISGVVTRVEKNDHNDDYVVRLTPGALSPYSVEIDHVTAVKVEPGDVVKAGQIIGKPGEWGSGIGRVELQMNRGGEYLCPVEFLATSVRLTFENKLTQLMADWESVKSDTSIYDESAFLVPGCLESSIAE